MTRLALIGVGKIARDQHLPAIAGNAAFDLVATASPHGRVEGVPGYADLAELLANGPQVEAVALCTPPDVRHAVAAQAIAAGLHVMLEKPPAATVTEANDLVTQAAEAGVTLQATWHSRHAPAVAPAKAWLAGKTVQAARIVWREDIRRWHPGQEWILAAGGFGVFDPGINALSILSEILPAPVRLTAATMGVPEGRAAPLTADLSLQSGAAAITANFDFLEVERPVASITVETDAGTLVMGEGGDRLTLAGETVALAPETEYPQLYRQFAGLIAAGNSDVDLLPLQLVADAFLVAERQEMAPFAF